MAGARRIVFLPHGNIQYSQLHPSKRRWVIENSYEPLFDLVLAHDYRIGFEASGETVAAIARECPRALEKLKALIGAGKVEPVASPYTHIMLSNIDPAIGRATLIDGRDAWEEHTGVRPDTGWNPECGWASYIPEIFAEAGFKTLVMDADSFLLSFPAIREATGLSFDVQGHSNKNLLFRIESFIKDKPDFLRYITNPSRTSAGLHLIFRSDMMSNLMLWYLMGATEEHREQPVALDEIRAMLAAWQPRIEQTGTFIMPYAEDAEYIGTSAYFYIKQFGEARFFESKPESVERFKQLLDTAVAAGYALSTPSEVVATAAQVIENDLIYNIENGVAWHGGTAKAWANTTYSRLLDPVCAMIVNGITAVGRHLGSGPGNGDERLRAALRKVTSAYVSDSRWPPAPTSPGRFNVEESIADLFAANTLVGEAMAAGGIAARRSLYSPALMETQIRHVRDELMQMPYFGE
ncbi:MAG: glycoside hydrolase family 57 [Kiritimatiellae bacterium]|nr:glycoside hydrolase family 57 [Kiritimatiellia bacterium]